MFTMYGNESVKYLGFSCEEYSDIDITSEDLYVDEAIQQLYTYFRNKNIPISLTQYTGRTGVLGIIVMKGY